MAKLGDINFSIPEGADPMGVGIPDLGKSSYDPLETIRRGWQDTNQRRTIKKAEEREDWKAKKAAIPTFEAVNAKVAKILNDKAMELGRVVDQEYKSGGFFPLAKTPSGEKSYQKLAKLESEISSEGEAYNAMLPKYKAAQEIINDPKNRGLIDEKYSTEQMNKFAGAKDIEGMAEVVDKLFAFKPTPINMMAETTVRMEDYLGEQDFIGYTTSIDPTTGKFIGTETLGYDPMKVATAMGHVYDDLMAEKDEFTNYVTAQYEKAKKVGEANNADGVPMDEKEWFKSRYVPGYADAVNTSVSSLPKDSDTDSKSLRWYIDNGYPTDKGFGWTVVEDGIRLNYKSTLPNSRGMWIETDKLHSIPKGVDVVGDVVLGAPLKINNDGTVTLGITGGKLKKVPDQAEAKDAMSYGDGESNWVIRDGVVYELEKGSGFTNKIKANYNDIKDILEANFPMIDEAWKEMAKEKGWTESYEYKIPDSVKGSFNKIVEFGKKLLTPTSTSNQEKQPEESLDEEFLKSIGANIRK